jgi:hypothetical protein
MCFRVQHPFNMEPRCSTPFHRREGENHPYRVGFRVWRVSAHIEHEISLNLGDFYVQHLSTHAQRKTTHRIGVGRWRGLSRCVQAYVSYLCVKFCWLDWQFVTRRALDVLPHKHHPYMPNLKRTLRAWHVGAVSCSTLLYNPPRMHMIGQFGRGYFKITHYRYKYLNFFCYYLQATSKRRRSVYTPFLLQESFFEKILTVFLYFFGSHPFRPWSPLHFGILKDSLTRDYRIDRNSTVFSTSTCPPAPGDPACNVLP